MARVTAASATAAPTSTTWFESGGAWRVTLATESMSAVTDVDRTCGRSVVRPRAGGLEEGGQPGHDLLALGDRRRDDDEREAQHGHEERGVDDEDRRAATERQPIADEADDRLERGRQQDRDEQQDEDAARRDRQRDQADDERDPGGDARATDGPGGQIGAHATTSAQPSLSGRSVNVDARELRRIGSGTSADTSPIARRDGDDRDQGHEHDAQADRDGDPRAGSHEPAGAAVDARRDAGGQRRSAPYPAGSSPARELGRSDRTSPDGRRRLHQSPYGVLSRVLAVS